MSHRDPRFDPLFEPIKIGPVTAKNRFYQVPHCTGIGWIRPHVLAELRGMKAAGGWGVVCTEYCSIHPSSDDAPHPTATLWNQRDIKAHSLMTEKVHEHGALAGVELWYGGAMTPNLDTREVSLGVQSSPNWAGNPFQTKAMDKKDIRKLRRWHRDAALRAKQAGFDIVYVYASHHYLLDQFLSHKNNNRTDEYGGSLENRVRLVRELIEETKDAVGDQCAVAVRFSADAGGGADGVPLYDDRREMFEMLAELPDLWDINISDYSYEMGTSRFVKEAALNPYMAHIKAMTSKPVVTVGRFTSPETMLTQITSGISDFIGAARPSIADPFLPKKIAEGRFEAIRECIGCNICYVGDGKGVPTRCTQNPTMSEEWRRGWHPETIEEKASAAKILIIGAGPAGLEAARALGQRGYPVILAEANRELGGRVLAESKLPGLSEWLRVRDYRSLQIETMDNVEVFRESRLSAEEVFDLQREFDITHVVVATGAHWRTDGFGRHHRQPLSSLKPASQIFTPDDIMAGRLPTGPTLIFDDDHYYIGGIIAERLREKNIDVTLLTTESKISAWADYTEEQFRIQQRMLSVGVTLVTGFALAAYDGSEALISCIHTGTQQQLPVQAIVMVTARTPNDALYQQLQDKLGARPEFQLTRIGDCEAPAIIASAVYAGHRYAREFDSPVELVEVMRHDRVLEPSDQ